MRLIDHHKAGARSREAVAPPVTLDVIQADDGEGVGVEKGLGDGEAAFQFGGGRGRDRNGVEVELGFEFPGPLIDEMRRTQDGKAIDLAPIDELA